MQRTLRAETQVRYGLATFYAIVTAVLLSLQEPFSALAARKLSSVDFMAFTQLALLCSLPFLLGRSESRRDFLAILLAPRHWPKLAVIFLVGVAGLALYDIGLSSAHPIITAAVLNLSPFWAALVAFVISKRSVSGSPLAFAVCFVVAFCGAMAIAWSQIDVRSDILARDVVDSILHSKWLYALPMPAFFALSGTLVYEWFLEFDVSATMAANFVVSSVIMIPVAVASSAFGGHSRLSEQSAAAILLLLVGTLAASASGRIFYQLALTESRNDNGYVTMFFLLIPPLSALISLPLSGWIPNLTFIPAPMFFIGMTLVTAPLAAFTLISRRGARA